MSGSCPGTQCQLDTSTNLSPATGAWQVKGLQGGVGCPSGLQLFRTCSRFTWEHLPTLTLTSNQQRCLQPGKDLLISRLSSAV